jgi:DMSO/TMAO reductase YedYZ molybdopterin-dependent catalytic subunit
LALAYEPRDRSLSINVELPPGQQLAAADKWPVVGERAPAQGNAPWIVSVTGLVARPVVFTLDELRELPGVERAIDIHCVTRWSKPAARFAGARLADVLDRAGPLPSARFVSFVARSPREHATSLPLDDALRLETLVALDYEGQPLAAEHGGPVRTVTPGRYFYKSLKWLRRIELLEHDRLGYWEAQAGYHNTADPWLQQRFIAASLTKREAAALLAARDFSSATTGGLDLRGLDAAGHDLTGLRASQAVLRDADFRRATLRGACFDGANLANARFAGADLRGATFRGTDMEGADLTAADLRGVDFSGALLTAVTFCDPSPSADGARAEAVLDEQTRIDPGALEVLMPAQREFLLKRRT